MLSLKFMLSVIMLSVVILIVVAPQIRQLIVSLSFIFTIIENIE
jgi:hypothetical protein